MTSLLQWLWQGSAVAVTLWLALRCAPRINAATRYALWWAVLVAVLLLPLITHSTMFGNGSMALPRVDAESLAPGASLVSRPLIELPAPPDWLVACGIGAWLGSVLLGFGRLTRGLVTVRQLERRSRRLARAVERSLSLRRQWRRAGRRHAALRVSSSVSGACALGLLGRPAIVVSDRLVTTLDREDLDLIILHEQVHLARYDDWATLLQSCISVLVGWHPAVRVITAALDAEREAACDDAVAARIGNAVRYATCLADAADAIAARRLSSVAAIVPHAAGTGSLLLRVRRLLDPRVRRRAAVQRLVLGSGIAGLAAASAVAIAVGPIVGTRAAETVARRSTPDAVPRPVDLSNAVIPTGVGHTTAPDPARVVDRHVARPAPVDVNGRSASARRTMTWGTTSLRRPLSSVASPIQIARVEVRRNDTDSSGAPVVALAANNAAGEAAPPPIPGRVLVGPPAGLIDVSSPEAGGTESNAALDAEPGLWATVGRHVAREVVTVGQQLAQRSTAFGRHVARRGNALGGFFGRTGKAVAEQF